MNKTQKLNFKSAAIIEFLNYMCTCIYSQTQDIPISVIFTS